jgi:DNA-binding NarL/FixJ family response regulator
MIRVLLVEDHALVRAGLAQLIENAPDMELAGAAANGREAIALAGTTSPDVVLMDLSMPVMDGIAATKGIVATVPGAHVVVLTSFDDRERIVRALQVGALGYVLKDVEPEELFRAIRAAARGLSPLTPRVAHTLLSEPIRHLTARPRDLSAREMRILELVARGMPNHVVAERLGLSEKTVKNNLTAIFRTIGAGDRHEAATWAAEHGIVES